MRRPEMPDLRMPSRMSMRRRKSRGRGPMFSLAFAAVGFIAGIGLMLLFDPASRRRRALARDKAVHIANRTSKRANRTMRTARSGMRGMRHRIMHETPPERLAVDDRTLEQRVQSVIFRDHHDAKASVSVDVHEGVVSLRGTLPDERSIASLEREARRVPGVCDVQNYLHLEGTVAPNKMDAVEASEAYLQERVLPSRY